jgi:hypothetical protein
MHRSAASVENKKRFARSLPRTKVRNTAIEGLTKYLQKWQDEGFHTITNGTVFENTVAKIRERKAPM